MSILGLQPAQAAGAQLRTSHARFARLTAERMGLAFQLLDIDGYLFEVSTGDRHAAFPAGAGSPYALNSARGHGLARDKAFTALMLARAGVPVIETRLFFATSRHAGQRSAGREPEDARAFALEAPYPLFCKPNSGARGDLAEIVADAGEFVDYLERVAQSYDLFLVQPVVEGVEHRVLILDGEAIASYRKRPPTVTGDGVATLADLTARLRAASGHSAARAAPLARTQGRGLHARILAAADVPAAGERVEIFGARNRAQGGEGEAVSSPAPAALAAIGRACCQALGLRLAGVDLFDVSPAQDLSALVVIEVNSSPALETLEAQGRLDLIERIWRANIEAALR